MPHLTPPQPSFKWQIDTVDNCSGLLFLFTFTWSIHVLMQTCKKRNQRDDPCSWFQSDHFGSVWYAGTYCRVWPRAWNAYYLSGVPMNNWILTRRTGCSVRVPLAEVLVFVVVGGIGFPLGRHSNKRMGLEENKGRKSFCFSFFFGLNTDVLALRTKSKSKSKSSHL